MLELRPVCENCAKSLPNASNEAMICTFECTFCVNCVECILHNVCPNCGGGFEKRPTRPAGSLLKFGAKTELVLKPIDADKFKLLLEEFRDIEPRQR